MPLVPHSRMVPVLMSGGADPYRLNLATGFTAWRAARSTGHPIIWMYGDSVGTGAAATNPATEGWMQRLKARLHTLYGTGGAWHGWSSAAYTKGAGWTQNNLGPSGADSFYHYGAGTETLVLTATGKYFDIYYAKASITGDFTMQLDTETPVAGQKGGAVTVVKATLTAAEEGEHTITITPGMGATEWLFFCGIIVRNAAGGAIVTNASVSGYSTESFWGDTNQPKALPLIAPALTIIALGLNDYNGQKTLANFTTYVNRGIVSAASGSCMIVLENPGEVAGKTIPKSSYDAILWEAARTNALPAINIDGLWGGFAAATASGLMADTLHPTTAGHTSYYALIEPWITA